MHVEAICMACEGGWWVRVCMGSATFRIGSIGGEWDGRKMSELLGHGMSYMGRRKS